MVETITILCTTFLAVLVAYWIMPDRKVKVVNDALIGLLKALGKKKEE